MEISCYCSTTRQSFTAAAQQIEYVNGVIFVWVLCPYCDNYRRTQLDRDYDPATPQWHCQQVDTIGAMRRKW